MHVVPVVSNTTCLGWNGTHRVNQSSDSLGLTAGPTPRGTAGLSQCNFKPTAANVSDPSLPFRARVPQRPPCALNLTCAPACAPPATPHVQDEMFIVTPTDSGFVTFRDGVSNGTRCLEVANRSTDVGALLQLSQGTCANASHQQFQLWTRTKGGFVLLARHSGQPLMVALGSTTAVFQSQFDLNVLANNVSFTSFVFAVQPEPGEPRRAAGKAAATQAATATSAAQRGTVGRKRSLMRACLARRSGSLLQCARRRRATSPTSGPPCPRAPTSAASSRTAAPPTAPTPATTTAPARA